MGSVFDVYSNTKDSRVDVRENEYFVNNRINGSYIHINNVDDVTIKTPNGAKIKIGGDGSFKFFNGGNFGIECDASGNFIFRGVTINSYNVAGSWP